MIPFPMIELAVKELIELRYSPALGKTGGDLSYERGDGLYVWFALVSGSTGQLEGSWAVDVDVFADDYATAMQHALNLESYLLGRPYEHLNIMRIDSITQNEAPVERPWDDDGVFRVGATYSFSARRSA